MSGWQAGLDRRFAEGVQWARWAVSRWREFPVDQRPRPLIIVGERCFVERGFRTGEAKMAYLDGRSTASVTVPGPVMLALSRPANAVGARAGATALHIVGAERSETTFRTDRGPVKLAAWRLQAEDALGPIWVLDPDLERTEWRPPEQPPAPHPELQSPLSDPGTRAEAFNDDCALTVHFLGASRALVRYPRAEVIESPQAVAVVPEGQDIGPPGARNPVGQMHTVTVQLGEPLGARVFVDLHGNAREVLHL